MNNEKLILEGLNWLLSNSMPHTELADKERQDLFGRIDSVVNPEVEPTIAEKTEEIFGDKSKKVDDALLQETEVKE